MSTDGKVRLKMLLDAGADPNPHNANGESDIFYMTENSEMLRILLSGGMKVDALNGDGWTALMTAVRDAKCPAVDVLFATGWGHGALFIALFVGRSPVSMIMLNLGIALVAVVYLGSHPRFLNAPADGQMFVPEVVETVMLMTSDLGLRGMGAAIIPSQAIFSVHFLMARAATALLSYSGRPGCSDRCQGVASDRLAVSRSSFLICLTIVGDVKC